ncbi:hypothetical protein BSKO_05168 [Bryopsis sp. KO-2023]|nr:hypothetical protein BSKO_05168 [Bryopsis sp. KO-2023]
MDNTTREKMHFSCIVWPQKGRKVSRWRTRSSMVGPPRLRFMAPRLRGHDCRLLLSDQQGLGGTTDCQMLCLLEMSSLMKWSFRARMSECLAVKMLNSWWSDSILPMENKSTDLELRKQLAEARTILRLRECAIKRLREQTGSFMGPNNIAQPTMSEMRESVRGFMRRHSGVPFCGAASQTSTQQPQKTRSSKKKTDTDAKQARSSSTQPKKGPLKNKCDADGATANQACQSSSTRVQGKADKKPSQVPQLVKAGSSKKQTCVDVKQPRSGPSQLKKASVKGQQGPSNVFAKRDPPEPIATKSIKKKESGIQCMKVQCSDAAIQTCGLPCEKSHSAELELKEKVALLESELLKAKSLQEQLKLDNERLVELRALDQEEIDALKQEVLKRSVHEDSLERACDKSLKESESLKVDVQALKGQMAEMAAVIEKEQEEKRSIAAELQSVRKDLQVAETSLVTSHLALTEKGLEIEVLKGQVGEAWHVFSQVFNRKPASSNRAGAGARTPLLLEGNGTRSNRTDIGLGGAPSRQGAMRRQQELPDLFDF